MLQQGLSNLVKGRIADRYLPGFSNKKAPVDSKVVESCPFLTKVMVKNLTTKIFRMDSYLCGYIFMPIIVGGLSKRTRQTAVVAILVDSLACIC